MTEYVKDYSNRINKEYVIAEGKIYSAKIVDIKVNDVRDTNRILKVNEITLEKFIQEVGKVNGLIATVNEVVANAGENKYVYIQQIDPEYIAVSTKEYEGEFSEWVKKETAYVAKIKEQNKKEYEEMLKQWKETDNSSVATADIDDGGLFYAGFEV